MDNLSDENLLDRYFAGDAEAFVAFYCRHAGRVVGYAVSKGLRLEVAHEVGQEAFLKLHRSIHRYEKGRPALPWFFTIVHNCIVDALRQGKNLVDLRYRVALEGVGVTRAVGFGVPLETLARLPDEQRRVFEMRVVNELSFREISTATGKSEVALRKVFERARRRLKDILSGDE